MPENNLPEPALAGGDSEEEPRTPPQICITRTEWEEIAGCTLALSAAIDSCEEMQRDGPYELARSVQMRLDGAVAAVERRIFGD